MRVNNSGGGKFVLAGSSAGTVNIWDTDSAKLAAEVAPALDDEQSHHPITCAAWSIATNSLFTSFRGQNHIALWGA